MEEGYIKFNCVWNKQPVKIPDDIFNRLNTWRDILYKLNLIGAYDKGIGFGNVSMRSGESLEFFITGTATGTLKSLTADNYSLVRDFDIEKNTLTCSGEVKASAESLTHGAVYRADNGIHGVIHVHHSVYWAKLLNHVPTTLPEYEFGTPGLANDILRLFGTSDVRKKKIIVMAGHPDGIITFGKTLEEAGSTLLAYINELS